MTNGLDLDGSRPFDSSFRQGKKVPSLVNVDLFHSQPITHRLILGKSPIFVHKVYQISQ